MSISCSESAVAALRDSETAIRSGIVTNENVVTVSSAIIRRTCRTLR